MDNTSLHIPVLKSDSVQQLITDKNGIYIDATLGYGGHAREILDTTTKNAKIYGIDKDIDAIEFNQNELTFVDMIDPIRGFVYSTANNPLNSSKNGVDFSSGILAYSDKFFLGFSTHHLTEPKQSIFSETIGIR